MKASLPKLLLSDCLNCFCYRRKNKMRDWKKVLKDFFDNRQEELLLKKGLDEIKKKDAVKKDEVKQEQKRKNQL